MSQPLHFQPTAEFAARSRAAAADPALRRNFRGAMDFLQAKRRAQFPDAGELSELRRNDVDTTSWTIKVRRGVAFVPGSIVVKDPKTEAGKRDVAIPALDPPGARTPGTAHPQRPGRAAVPLITW